MLSSVLCWRSSARSSTPYAHLTVLSTMYAGLRRKAVRPCDMSSPRPHASMAPREVAGSGGCPVQNSFRKSWVYPLPVVQARLGAAFLMKGMSAAS
jgi:hypothetical protein